MYAYLTTPLGRAVCGLALLALLVAPVSAGEEAATGPAAEPAAPIAVEDGYVPVTVAGMQVAIDPKTGELRTPTPAERRALSTAFQNAFGPNRLARKAIVHRDASGMLSMQLGYEHLDSYVAEILPDGSVATRCESVLHTTHDHGAPPAVPEEK